jgi:hypothetical protein
MLAASAQEPLWAQPPIEYGVRPSRDRVARLAEQLASGERVLDTDNGGFLPGLLRALEVSVNSQTTVFSRTSFQARLITTVRPRALYFSDDVYVGYVPASEVFELTAVDPNEGLVFYTLTNGEEGPVFQRETHLCLQCHAPARNGEMPSNLVRSIHPADDGTPVLRAGSRHVDHTTPYEERWGGWYVTGDTGEMAHLGNQVLEEEQERLGPMPGDHASLKGLCGVNPYPVETSDVVALMVLEHQAAAHNVLTWVGYESRRAIHYQRELNRELKEPEGTVVNSTERRLDAAAKKLVRALLLAGEAKLPNSVGEGSAFAADFQAAGLKDSKGRSLRDLDLKVRLFRYPLSYLVYTEAFAGLPERLSERVWRELWRVLNNDQLSADDPHLEEVDRVAVMEILKGTWPGELPDYWNATDL